MTKSKELPRDPISSGENIAWIDSVWWDQCFGTIKEVRGQIVYVAWGEKIKEFDLSYIQRNRHGLLVVFGNGPSFLEREL